VVSEVLPGEAAGAHRVIARAVTGALGAAMFASAVTALVGAQQPPPAQRNQPRENWAANLPPGEGKALVEQRCTVCHDLRGTIQLRKSRPAWEAIVLDMGARGAPITIDDIDPLVNYLSTAFGPQAPPLTDANAASKAELLKLPGVAPDAADRLIAARTAAALRSEEEVRTALALDAQAFDKIRYYVYVRSPASAKRQ
jgi:mono/diheme cytochrome c family protein